jgi:hypothetical protein
MDNALILINCTRILESLKITPTPVRVQILKFALCTPDNEFTIAQIKDTLWSQKISISLSAILATTSLYKTRSILLVSKEMAPVKKITRKNGRPTSRLYVSKAIIEKYNSLMQSAFCCL